MALQVRKVKDRPVDKEILFEFDEDALLVANGGRPFSRKGVISVCASHLSDKQLGGVTDHFDADDKQLVQAIRCNELAHYKDPNRVTSDSNNERETTRDYTGRFVWELLQNADDAMGEGRSSDVLIGSKGLGFKAVLEVTDEPEIHSGPFHFLFSATKTQELLKKERLHTNPPPLTFRIPHECEPGNRVRELLDAGYATVMRLPFRTEETERAAMDQLRDLDALFLFLAQELSCVRIRVPEGETVHDVTRSEPRLSNGNVKLSTRGPNGSSSILWRRWVQCRPAPTDTSKQLTVAICLPLTKQGDAIPHSTNVPFHVFFPTEEDTGTRALIHASLDLEYNRKRVRKGEYDANILQEFSELFQDVLNDIPARTALEAFGKIASEYGNSPLLRLQKKIRGTLSETPFIPIIGGGRVKPGEVQLWQDRLGFVLQDKTQQVQDEYLLVPELSDLKNVLKGFDAQDIKDEDYIWLLRYCRNNSLEECLASWRVFAEGGLKRVSSEYSDHEELLKVPCWWTETGAARALNGTRPLLFARPEGWPDWLPADSLHPSMRKVLEQWETKDEIPEIWRELIPGWLLKQREEYLHDVLLPFVAKWDDERWEADGWRALRQVLSWSVNRKFENVLPWIKDTDGNQEEKRRAQAARMLRIPIDKGWLLASDCYAGKDWDGPPTFDRFFASVKARGIVRPFQKWPNRIRKGTDKGQWKALLRWAGVSWEPKVRCVEDLPDHYLVENYRSDSKVQAYTYWIRDWEIESFSEYIQNTNDEDKPARVIRTMLSLAEAVRKHKAIYMYYKEKHPYRYANFADYQLRHEAWLPCKPALFGGGRQVAPYDAFLPGEGIPGLLPEVDRSGIGNEEWFQCILRELRSLGVRNQLPEDPTKWHEWMRELPKLAEQLAESERKIPDRGEEAGGLYRAADALYRGYLKLEWESRDDLYRRYLKPAWENEFPEDIDIPCLAWENDRETLMFSPPSEVYYVDEPHFDEVRQDILRKGYKLFIVRLDAGSKAPERLGVRRLSDMLSAEPQYDEMTELESQKLLQSYRERHHGLSVAASLPKPLPEELNIIAVRGLRLKLTANGKSVTDVQVLSWRSKDGKLLINLNKDRWRALGHGLAARVSDAENKASLFENLLRESDKEGYLDRLRQEGVTEDDIREAENAWPLGEPSEQGTDDDGLQGQKPSQELTSSIGSSQGTAPGSQNPQEETPQTSHPETSGGGGGRPSGNPTPGNGALRPRPETGLAAEDWLYERLKRIFSQVDRHVRDDENRESDFVISSGRRKFHIEVKHTANRPGTFHWSGLQCEKARDFEGKSDEYVMAILFPNGEQDYEIRWIWRPLDELRKASREVQWAGDSGYDPVNIDSWDVAEGQPPNVPTKRYEFRIKLNDETLEAFQRDTEALKALSNKING